MNYLFLVFAVSASGIQNIVATAFNRANQEGRGTGMYNILYTVTNFLCWIGVWLTEPSFRWEVLPYCVGFAFCYAISMFGLLGALAYGSASLTAFVKQLSLVGVAVWGFFFWQTPVTVTVIAGLLLIAVALLLCLMNPHSHGETGTVTKKYLLYSLMLFGGNTFYSVIQKYQQINFNGQNGAMFMCVGSLFAAVMCILFSLRSKPSLKSMAKKSWIYPVLGGVLSCVLNRSILTLATSTLSPALIYPAVAVGSMTIGILFSVLAYKERLPRRKWVGLAAGTAAVALLNL
ncbi:MAG: EamA family transporter [Clostridia bacterium]|nr:EamA family transporter [Clostridia bacterium]